MTTVEDSGTFTVTGQTGTATRLDILTALTDTGLFAGSVPVLDLRLSVGDYTFYLNTDRTLASVNLSMVSSVRGTLSVTFDQDTGVLDLTLNNVDAPTGQDLRDALESLEFIVFSTEDDLDAVIDTTSATANLQIIAENERNAALAFDSPIAVTLPCCKMAYLQMHCSKSRGCSLFSIGWRLLLALIIQLQLSLTA